MLYKANDSVHYVYETITAQDIWNKDLDKKTIASINGYDVLYIWESEINNKSDEELKTLVINLLKTHYETLQNKIYKEVG